MTYYNNTNNNDRLNNMNAMNANSNQYGYSAQSNTNQYSNNHPIGGANSAGMHNVSQYEQDRIIRDAQGSLSYRGGVEDTFQRGTVQQDPATQTLKDMQQKQIDQMQQMGSQQRARADFKPEVFFIGQIVGGQDFPTDQDGIFVEACLKYGDDWTLFEKNQVQLQTHTAYADDEGFFVFAHPFDFHFSCESIQGWPKLQINVWRLDQYGKLDTIAYGVVNLPNETGAFDLECPTWRPMTGWREESYNFYLGGPPKLLNTDPIVRDLSQRKFLTSMSSGTVIIHCEVLMRAFRDQNISGDR